MVWDVDRIQVSGHAEQRRLRKLATADEGGQSALRPLRHLTMGMRLKDPLAGMRRDIAHGKLKVLRWPADKPCPVEKGDRFEVLGLVIEIHTLERKFAAGKPPEWHATFIRHEPDKVYLVRQAPPVHAGSEQDADLDLSAEERARRDGNYTSSRVAAMPMEPESVGPDWKDKHQSERELRRQNDRLAMKAESEARSQARRLKLDAARVIIETHSKGKDLTPLLSDIYARLASQQEENERAA